MPLAPNSDYQLIGFATPDLGTYIAVGAPMEFNQGYPNSLVLACSNSSSAITVVNSIYALPGAPNAQAPFTLKLDLEGNTAKVYYNGALVATVTVGIGSAYDVGLDWSSAAVLKTLNPAAFSTYVFNSAPGAAVVWNYSNIAYVGVQPILPNGKGDITDPYAWTDFPSNGGSYVVPPSEFDNLAVQGGVGEPNNGDGRYWWEGNATSVVGGPIAFVGDPAYLVDTGVLVWQIEQAATDGSQPVLQYSKDGGSTWTAVNIGAAPGSPQAGINQSGSQDVTLGGATGFAVKVTSTGGNASATAKQWKVAVAIVRNVYAVVPWDLPHSHDPISYNAEIADLPNTDTLGNLISALMYRLGFGAQAANPPPGMSGLLTQFLQDSQKMLYRKYSALHMRRFFRWKLVPGIRFYSLKDNDENVLGSFHLDPTKTIEWAGMQDSRNVWYPLIEGIPPQLYTMISKPWRPSRYEIRQAIEVYPVPDQTYWLWIKGHFGLLPFAANTDTTTLDSELVYLHALANAKAHYGQPDADKIMKQAADYLGQLVAGGHGTRTYVPGTIAVPPAVRPTLIQFMDNQSS